MEAQISLHGLLQEKKHNVGPWKPHNLLHGNYPSLNTLKSSDPSNWKMVYILLI